jgi:D-xylose transport system substrate-binding protein
MRCLRPLILLLVLVLFACGPRREAAEPVSPASPGVRQRPGEQPLTIGFSIATATFIIERWNKDLKVFTGAAQELGADVIVQLSAGGIREQISQINYMVNQNIDILVVIAHDTELIAGAIKQVKDAGIPVIAYDRLIQTVPLDAYVSFDSREVGRHFGRALREAVPRGRYLVVNGSIHDVNSSDISAGIHEIIDPSIQSGAVRLREIWLEEWSSDEALEKIGAIFNETTNFDAIAGGNDAIAGAAVQLLAERRLAGKVVVVGQDAELSACQRIVEGTQLMTVYKPIGSLGVRAARLAVALARKARGLDQGEISPPDSMVDNNSGEMIPAYLEKSTVIYKDSVDVVIRDGFHSREDIYRNVGTTP